MDKQSDVKLRWIKDCALALDPKDSSIAAVSLSILAKATKTLKDQEAAFPTGHALMSEFRITCHILNSLCMA